MRTLCFGAQATYCTSAPPLPGAAHHSAWANVDDARHQQTHDAPTDEDPQPRNASVATRKPRLQPAPRGRCALARRSTPRHPTMSTRNAPSVADLAKQARNYTYNVHIPLANWLRTANTMQKEVCCSFPQSRRTLTGPGASLRNRGQRRADIPSSLPPLRPCPEPPDRAPGQEEAREPEGAQCCHQSGPERHLEARRARATDKPKTRRARGQEKAAAGGVEATRGQACKEPVPRAGHSVHTRPSVSEDIVRGEAGARCAESRQSLFGGTACAERGSTAGYTAEKRTAGWGFRGRGAGEEDWRCLGRRVCAARSLWG